MKIYENEKWLFQHYVKRRMSLQAMSDLLLEKYNTKITPQGIYLHLQKHDLLKYRGKGKKKGANMQRPQGHKTAVNPKRAREQAMRRANRRRG